jgi:restriction system protein
MKLKMAKNSLFAVLLRSPWWASAAIGVVLGLLAAALLPPDLRAAGAVSGAPFFVIAALAAWKRRGLPSAQRIEATQQAVATMTWAAFEALLLQAFQRDGFELATGKPPAGVDFVLLRGNRRQFVAARRWKSAHIGLEPLRALQAAREAGDGERINDALYIGLGELGDAARQYAAGERIAVWRADEIALALRGIDLKT